MTSAYLPVLSNDSIQQYCAFAELQPVLTKEQELELATRLQEKGELKAAQQLILSNVRYVIRIARGYQGYGLALVDLIQEGTVGLMKAVKRFQPKHGVRLLTYAAHWIKAEIHEFVVKNWRIVKIATSKPQKKLFFNLRSKKKNNSHWLTQQEIQQIADDLQVPTKDVVEMEQRLYAHDSPFDLPSSDEEHHFAPEDYLACKKYNPESEYLTQHTAEKQSEKLHEVITKLDSRSMDIISSRWLGDSKATLDELSQRHGISKERVRQIEQKAMLYLQAELND